MAVTCPLCAAPVLAEHAFCEACGHELDAPACAACGAQAVDADGYCERCGLRQPTGRDEAELTLPGGAAAVTHKGLRRARNEDAMALLEAGDVTVAVVCDGVGSSPRADEASAVAVETAAPALARGMDPAEAFALAGRAVAKLGSSPDDAPACTYVSAVVSGGRATLAWAGDTRVYWLPHGPGPVAAVRLTDDHATSTGEITAWLGADAGDWKPSVRVFEPPGPGSLLVCSDGLWRYLDGHTVPGAAVHPAGASLDLARELLRFALGRGGHDNVTIVLIPLGGQHG
ncbi:PP2C family serine/threonine-protein phosphatase [Nonomuraea roseoviolacea]|uniref:Serine/threonine protein phosphatase PrpC n=1 Tax=Nonomuraea roseoviolacea subsp. carminata TaxID=160689 RepID=A0ABT1JSN1_9ACTN|nr:protein phosphatase 2C domain-containing protein [Nonomuraea roseoviolacea]MCP2344759.1 serine/threonine protein phosphatase PrpC [Nonomuraea roseoviolacea subsp. carminata]